jgi:hypothetical protein
MQPGPDSARSVTRCRVPAGEHVMSLSLQTLVQPRQKICAGFHGGSSWDVIDGGGGAGTFLGGGTTCDRSRDDSPVDNVSEPVCGLVAAGAV